MSTRVQTARPPFTRRGSHPRTLTWRSAKWADGVTLQAWVVAGIAPERLAACGLRETISGWKDRGRVSFWVVDRAFVPLGLHVSQLPDEVWVA